MAQWKIPPYCSVKAVVFDMDGLMLDTERIIRYSWDVTGKELGYKDFGNNILNTLGMSRAQRDVYFIEKYGKDFPLQDFMDGYHKVYWEYEKKKGIPRKKGLLELLELLQTMDIPMAVATSSRREHSIEALKKQDILHYFQEIVTGDMVQKGKPDPEIYSLACKKLGVLPDCTLALEDSYNGIRSAYGAGMKVIMIPDILTDHEPVRDCLFGKMESLLDVAKWLQEKMV